MTGTLYGIGVGPGDPELMTLKAVKAVENSDIIAYPVKKKGEHSVALDIAAAVTDISIKESLELPFSMDPDDKIREACRKINTDVVCRALDAGRDVSVVTLGDVGVYSTFMYIATPVKEKGYDVNIIPGIPSFCSGAASAGIPLMLGSESLAIVQMAKGSKDVAAALDGFCNVIVMKVFDSMGRLLDMMAERNIPASCGTVISNIGMENEYIGPMMKNRRYGYFTTVLIKKGDSE